MATSSQETKKKGAKKTQQLEAEQLSSIADIMTEVRELWQKTFKVLVIIKKKH